MEANELMIGDWVNFLIDIEGGDTENDQQNDVYQPMQVGSISCLDEVSSVFYGVINDISQLRPIPLTAEILEKNFNGADPYGIYFFSDDYIEVYIKEYTEGLWRVEVNEIEMGGLPTWRMYVSDVHQLQHALRLCNIEKEIEL